MKLNQHPNRTAEEFQDYILPLVSRTFSFTIPQLPIPLRRVIGNFYLSCRALDTIEDDPELSGDQKYHYGSWLVDVVKNRRDADDFAREVAPLISLQMPEAERELMQHLPLVMKVTHGLSTLQRSAVECCISIMSRGMHYFQQRVSLNGLSTQYDMASYCYYVSGVVGEALTEIFCNHSPAVACKRKEMLELATSFGLGLQMTNILVDHWDDRKQGQCWLPRDLFASHGIDLSSLKVEPYSSEYGLVLTELIGFAHAHLRIALRYTLLIPQSESGIRRFCYWIISLAIHSLRNIHRKLNFNTAKEIKVARSRIAIFVILTKLSRCSDPMLIQLFNLAAVNLPLNSLVKERKKVSEWPSSLAEKYYRKCTQ